MNPLESSDRAPALRPSKSGEGLPPLDWAQAAGSVDAVTQSIERHVRDRRRRTIVATITAVAVMMSVGFTVWTSARRERERAAAAHRVVVSEPTRQTLADGSVVELRGDAAITVDFRGGVRHVVLLRGEAHFQVAKDAVHPFVVESAGVGVRAVGTAFVVRQADHAVEVVVTEGKVAVAEATRFVSPAVLPPDSTAMLVVAGERTLVDLTNPAMAATAQPISSEEIRNRLAWRVAKLEFNGTPLGEVLELFNARSAGQENVHLVLGDPELGSLPLSGALRADNVGVLLKILETSYGIQAKTAGDKIVLGRSK